MSLLEDLRSDGAALAESDLPAIDAMRPILGALVKYIEKHVPVVEDVIEETDTVIPELETDVKDVEAYVPPTAPIAPAVAAVEPAPAAAGGELSLTSDQAAELLQLLALVKSSTVAPSAPATEEAS